MDIIDKSEHVRCYRFDKSGKSAIELVRIAKGNKDKLHVHNNEVVFFMEGRVRFISEGFPDYERLKGQIVFLPAGSRYFCLALSPVTVIVFRVYDPIRLCDNFSIERLYVEKQAEDSHKPHTRHIGVLEINTRVWHFLDGVNDCLADGIRCGSYFDLKIKEFFLMLRMYYSKEDVYDFLYLALGEDTAFSEYVRLHWHRFRNVGEIAESMNVTARQFSSRFKAVFGQTPYKWMKEGRAKIIREQLVYTKKPIKQIAFENGFSDIPQFTKFCKKEIGKTPTEIRAEKLTGMQ